MPMSTWAWHPTEKKWARCPLYGGSPFDHSLLPDQHVVANAEEEAHDGGEEGAHDQQGGEDFVVIAVVSGPVDVPAQAGTDAGGFGHQQREEGSAQAHEQADENAG